MRKIFFAIALAGCFSAGAQVSIGPEMGLNISKFSGATEDYTMYSSGRVGFSADVRLADNFHLQPGLFYSSKGGNTVVETSQDLASFASLAGLGNLLGGLGNTSQFTTLAVTNNISYRINYIQLPVLAVYKFRAGATGRFFVAAGPYAAYAVDGRYKKSSVSSLAGVSINANEDRAAVTGDDMNAFDFGLNANLGYEHVSGFFCRGFYEMGLTDNGIGTNMSFGLSIGYFFGRNNAGN